MDDKKIRTYVKVQKLHPGDLIIIRAMSDKDKSITCLGLVIANVSVDDRRNHVTLINTCGIETLMFNHEQEFDVICVQ